MVSSKEITSVEIPIGPDDVGRVIGRAGSHIKLVRDRSGCDVEMVTTEGCVPFVRIRGQRPQNVEIATRMIADVAGGSGIAFIRDLTEQGYKELQANGWLKQMANQWNIQAEIRGKTLRIASDDQETSMKFKKLLEAKLCSALGLDVEQIQCPSGSIAGSIVDSPIIKGLHEKGLRIEREFIQQESDNIGSGMTITFTGPPEVVSEAMNFANGMLNETVYQRCEIPVWHGLMSRSSASKLSDLKADIHEVIIAKHGVDVIAKKGSNSVIVQGDNAESAAIELKEILQYYFKDTCALLTLPANWCDNSSLDGLLGTPSDLVYERTNRKIWLSGPPLSLQKGLSDLRGVVETYNRHF